MRSTGVIIILLFLLRTNSSFGQEEKIFDTAVSSESFRQFFLRNPAIDSVQFTAWESPERTIWVYKTDSLKKRKSEVYTMQFAGDAYSFQKKYGSLYLPENDMQQIKRYTCGQYYWIDGTSRGHSINLQLNYRCEIIESKDDHDEEMIFTKVEMGVSLKNGSKGYKKLVNALKAAIDRRYKQSGNIPGDSSALFRAIISPKDSLPQNLEAIDAVDPVFSSTIEDVLKTTGHWLPAIQCGLYVKAYVKIYVRLNADGSLLLDWSGK